MAAVMNALFPPDAEIPDVSSDDGLHIMIWGPEEPLTIPKSGQYFNRCLPHVPEPNH